MKKYDQLTQEKRYQMEALRATDPNILQKEIAKILGVHPSTISGDPTQPTQKTIRLQNT